MATITDVAPTKDILKKLNKFLSDKQTIAIADKNKNLHELTINLTEVTIALKDTYSPNIMRFMTSKDKYIKELISSAKHIMETVIPRVLVAAEALELSSDEKTLCSNLLKQLNEFHDSNQAKEEKVRAGKGDMIENTTHDIMEKYLQKDFSDIANLIYPICNTLKEKITN